MIDTHTHIYDEAFADDADLMVSRALEAGVTHVILPNVDASTVDKMRAFAHKYPAFCSMMMGIHPTEINETYLKELAVFDAEIQKRADDYVAIGEIGLDLYWDKTYLEQQKRAFEYQVDVAIQLGKPICIHSREAFHEIVDSLKKFPSAKLRGVFHCFTGTPEMAAQIARLGDFYYGIGGPATYKNAKFIDQIPQIPLSRILLETDAPYLPPVPFRGKRNEPAYLGYVAQKLADVYQISRLDLEKQVNENVKTLFFASKPNIF